MEWCLASGGSVLPAEEVRNANLHEHQITATTSIETRYKHRHDHPPTDTEKVAASNGEITSIHREIEVEKAYGEYIGMATNKRKFQGWTASCDAGTMNVASVASNGEMLCESETYFLNNVLLINTGILSLFTPNRVR